MFSIFSGLCSAGSQRVFISWGRACFAQSGSSTFPPLSMKKGIFDYIKLSPDYFLWTRSLEPTLVSSWSCCLVVHSSTCRLCCRLQSEICSSWISWFNSHAGSALSIHHPSCFFMQTARVSTQVLGDEFYQLYNTTCDLWLGNVVWPCRMWGGSKMMRRSRKTRRTCWPAWYPWDQWNWTSQESRVKIISTVISTFLWVLFCGLLLELELQVKILIHIIHKISEVQL